MGLQLFYVNSLLLLCLICNTSNESINKGTPSKEHFFKGDMSTIWEEGCHPVHSIFFLPAIT